MPPTSPAAKAAKVAAKVAMDRLDDNGDLMQAEAVAEDEAEIAPGQASPRARDSPHRAASEKGTPKETGKASPKTAVAATGIMKKPVGSLKPVGNPKGKGKASPKATVAAKTIMKKPSGRLGGGAMKKPAASEKPASTDTSLAAPAASEAIVPIDPEKAPTMRDIMKARKFQNLWDTGNLPQVVAERANEIKKQKKDGEFRENMTELINNTFDRDDNNKLIWPRSRRTSRTCTLSRTALAYTI